MLKVKLPLPPSKNSRVVLIVRGARTFPVVSTAVKKYREEVGEILLPLLPLADFRSLFEKIRDDKKRLLRIKCTWFLDALRTDVINYHDELADAIAPAIQINDKQFLIWDIGIVKTSSYAERGVEIVFEDGGTIWEDE